MTGWELKLKFPIQYDTSRIQKQLIPAKERKKQGKIKGELKKKNGRIKDKLLRFTLKKKKLK